MSNKGISNNSFSRDFVYFFKVLTQFYVVYGKCNTYVKREFFCYYKFVMSVVD